MPPYRPASSPVEASPEHLLCVLALLNAPASRGAWMSSAASAGLRFNGVPPAFNAHRSQVGEWIANGRVAEHPVHQLVVPLDSALQAFEAVDPHELAELARRVLPETTYYIGPKDGQSMLRVALVLGSEEGAAFAIDSQEKYSNRSAAARADWVFEAIGRTPRRRWLSLLPDTDRDDYVARLVAEATHDLSTVDADVLGMVHPRIGAEYFALRGELPEGTDELALLDAFARGALDEAADTGLRVAAALKRRKYRQLRGLPGAVHTLCCLATHAESPDRWAHAERASRDAARAKAGYDAFYEVVQAIVEEQHGIGNGLAHWVASRLRYFEPERRHAWVDALALGLALGLCPPSKRVRTHEAHGLASMWRHRALDNGYEGVAREFDAVLTKLGGQPPAPGTLAARAHLTEPWMAALAALESVASNPPKKGKRAAGAFKPHLRWQITLDPDGFDVHIAPYWVKSARSTKGTSASVATLAKGQDPRLSAQDRAVLDHVGKPRGWGRHTPRLKASALVALIGHPHATRDDASPVEVVRGAPRIEATSTDEGTRLSVVPERLIKRAIAYEDSPRQIIVYERDDALEQVIDAMQGKALVVPEEATERLGGVLSKLSATVEVRAQADVEIAGTEVPADATPVVRLGWDGTTLTSEIVVAPLGLDGPHAQPGVGARRVAATLQDEARWTLRDLEAETSRRDVLLAACPTLGEGAGAHDLFEALTLLMELEDSQDLASVVWPKGKPLRAPERAALSNLRVQVAQSTRWLEVVTEVAVDDTTMLSYRQLMESRGQQFVPLGEGRFIALSDELRSRLEALDAVSTPKKESAKASLATLPYLAEIATGAGSWELDAKSATRHAAFERALALNPKLPKAFKAELRAYQREGFEWMARLAEAGLGACLADDMGLGKTIQALALMTLRRKHGPALVVVPSSVAFNWVSEAARFAPSLRLFRLDQQSDRDETIAALGPSDVLVCSYGLLARESEPLSEVAFDTVVFDEAHLLKNAGTQRAKAARSLQAQFRLSLTGTPIENHVGELWSLMEATVPGLLGTAQGFNRRFAQPIADGNPERVETLRALVRPFMLRRTKEQVLGELPPRTETTLVVSPEPKERAFYEALRQRALEQLKLAGSKTRMVLLAHLTKLRMAAVDPRLVDPSGPRGAKLDALLERLDALREEGHRALVFSQFLGSMKQVADALTERGVVFQTLDGSTTGKERKRRIEAFQDGEGDVFIISLQAGGVGVNLTGADYVIHMDPWWNPAVEEQATSRSHRIGQERPVTVYRMVTEGTIEERILELHASKRDLAEGLLAGIDQAKKLDLGQIQALLGA